MLQQALRILFTFLYIMCTLYILVITSRIFVQFHIFIDVINETEVA